MKKKSKDKVKAAKMSMYTGKNLNGAKYHSKKKKMNFKNINLC